jgi:hypothetical protein
MTASKTAKRVAGLRDKLAKLAAERSDLERAPAARAEALDRVDCFIEASAARYAPPVNAFVAPVSDPASVRLIGVSRAAVATALAGGGRTAVEARFDQLEAALCALVPDAVRGALVDAVDAHLAPDPPGLPRAERAMKLAALDAKILAVEREEEQLIREARADGVRIDRRADADPAVVLGLAEEAA